jgi:hypothetical protein
MSAETGSEIGAAFYVALSGSPLAHFSFPFLSLQAAKTVKTWPDFR